MIWYVDINFLLKRFSSNWSIWYVISIVIVGFMLYHISSHSEVRVNIVLIVSRVTCVVTVTLSSDNYTLLPSHLFFVFTNTHTHTYTTNTCPFHYFISQTIAIFFGKWQHPWPECGLSRNNWKQNYQKTVVNQPGGRGHQIISKHNTMIIAY